MCRGGGRSGPLCASATEAALATASTTIAQRGKAAGRPPGRDDADGRGLAVGIDNDQYAPEGIPADGREPLLVVRPILDGHGLRIAQDGDGVRLRGNDKDSRS